MLGGGQVVKSQNSSIVFTFINVREKTKLYPLLSDTLLLKNNHKAIPYIDNKKLSGNLQIKTITALKNSKKLNCKLELIERNDTLFCKYNIESGADLIKLRVKLGETILIINFENIPRNVHYVINSIPIYPADKKEYFYNMWVLSGVVYPATDTVFLGNSAKLYKLNNGGEYVTWNIGFAKPEIRGLYNSEKKFKSRFNPQSCFFKSLAIFFKPGWYEEVVGDTMYRYSDSTKSYLQAKGKIKIITYKYWHKNRWYMEYGGEKRSLITVNSKTAMGIWEYYYPSGKLFLTCKHKSVRKNDLKRKKIPESRKMKGKWIYRNEDGSILKIERYRNNKRIS